MCRLCGLGIIRLMINQEYKRIYEESFRDMRTALQLFPIDCCDSKEELEHKKEKIYVLEADGKLIGSVAVYDNEIDDLIVARAFQRQGWGRKFLEFAIHRMQKEGIHPIRLHVADWNRGAMKLYKNRDFVITGTERVARKK